MGTILASAIITKAGLALTDTAQTRWTSAELLGWLNMAQRQIVQLVPSANNTTENLAMVAGTKQTLPSTAAMLLDVIRNMGAGGSTAGRAIRPCSGELLDTFNRDWHLATAAAEVQNYVYNPNDPATFYVYPPSTGSMYVLVNYSKIPADIAAGTAITLDDSYEGAILDYMLFRAHMKDAEYASPEVAQSYLSAFTSAIGGGNAAGEKSNPNQELSSGTPTSRGTS